MGKEGIRRGLPTAMENFIVQSFHVLDFLYIGIAWLMPRFSQKNDQEYYSDALLLRICIRYGTFEFIYRMREKV